MTDIQRSADNSIDVNKRLKEWLPT